tara:strand:+ start:3209 stop:3664 length:456 start_codon:yes stop_codon:yes gene_type:complete
MAHLIQPITIESTAYCNICQSGASTKGVASEIVTPTTVAPDVSNQCGPWEVILPTNGDNSEISFGVSCGTLVTISYVATSVDIANNDVIVELYIGGVGDGGTLVGLTTPNQTVGYNISDGPCGSVLSLAIYRNDLSGPDSITLGITIDSIA